MRKLSCLLLAATSVTACDRAPAFPQPPTSEYTAARFELVEGAKIDTVQGASITREFLRVSGVRAVLGRLFAGEDFQPTGSPVVVLSRQLWQRGFGSDPAIIGKPIRVNGRNMIVIGVMPREFAIPAGADIWLPRG